MKKIFLGFLIWLVISCLVNRPAEAYLENTHKQASIEALRLVEQTLPGEYQEIVRYAYDLIRGSREEDTITPVDGNERSFRHFFDPDAEPGKEGLRYRTYFKAWKLIGAQVTIPDGHHYPSALEWGRNGAGTGDPYNWEGALRAYDYTEGSHRSAYRRLGHVAHLIQDLAQPDHATATAHPGSHRRYERGGVLYYGFERVVDDFLPEIRGEVIRDYDTFDDFFIAMARHTKEVYRARGFSVPLGLKEFPLLGVYWTPDISESEAESYVELARDLLSRSAEINAGLFRLFRDIVNPPPFVEEVVVIQDSSVWGSGGGYRAQWEPQLERDPEGFLVVGERVLVREATPFFTEVPVTVRIRFGPPGKTMDHSTVSVKFLGEDLPGAMVDPYLWKGRFIPRLPFSLSGLELSLVIEARDNEQHFSRSGLPDAGYPLDSDPSSPARLHSEQPPYPWRDYKVAPDRIHRLFLINPRVAESTANQTGALVTH